MAFQLVKILKNVICFTFTSSVLLCGYPMSISNPGQKYEITMSDFLMLCSVFVCVRNKLPKAEVHINNPNLFSHYDPYKM